ncbi:MAG: FHA domain-containing protein [Gemmatimonadales bacterium]|jgi:pSer/pThr/pTyr-binding forkhead associated (FHA) protein
MGDQPVIKIYPPGTYVELDGDALYLGRDCHLAGLISCLLNRVVSNRHCVIRREGAERWMLEDLGSTNGTWIHGGRLAGKTLLHTGDEFTLGQHGPRVECCQGFGGTGADRTIAEDDLPLAEAVTLLTAPQTPQREPAEAGGWKPADARDGSADKPLRVGRTPSVRLVHQRTGEELTATGYTIVIGRDPASAQILIRADDEKHVSGRHTEIQFYSDGRVVVRDLGSRNGTWLNDRPLKDDAPLNVGDRLLLGNAPTELVVAALKT